MIDSDIKARVDLGIDSIVQKNIEKAKIQKPKIEFDRLKMYFGRPFTVTENLTIYEPTIGAIIDYGEKPFLKCLIDSFLIRLSSDYHYRKWVLIGIRRQIFSFLHH